MKTYTLDEITTEISGKSETSETENFDSQLKAELVGIAIRETRIKRNLTQTQLGKLVGVQKAQISKLENSFSNARLGTILNVFRALNAKILFKVELLNEELEIA